MGTLQAKTYQSLVLKSILFPLLLCVFLHLTFYISSYTTIFLLISGLKILSCIILAFIIRQNNQKLLLENAEKIKELKYIYAIIILLSIIIFNSMQFKQLYQYLAEILYRYLNMGRIFSIFDYLSILSCSMMILLLPLSEKEV